ncbi:4'-phosphopantetheinyl transferase family protein [Streptomyces sp. NPDC058045]|uniref:4'-phosphopantetheinyl transferase family protein n=1 Tax=Streptomyces sp. NPDC058045 TaxID=3346311 RepID=UPI0036F109D8
MTQIDLLPVRSIDIPALAATAGTGEPVPPPPGAGTVWLSPAATVPQLPAGLAESILSDEEAAKAARFVHDRDRHPYVAGHLAVRLLLAAQLGLPPREITLLREPCPGCGKLHGRPAVAPHHGLHFSLSHTRELAMVALAAHPVGVDVETLPAERTVKQLADQFHPAETASIRNLPPEQQTEGFARVWVRKEAYLKGLGIGLGRPLEADDLTCDPPGWTIREIDLSATHPGHRAALAVATG